MLYELGLLATLAVSLWIVVDLSGARGARWRRIPIMCLAGSCGVWVLGELVIGRASDPGQVLLGRRVLHLGVSFAPIAWLWTAAVFARARWVEQRPGWLAVAALPLLACYSFLYWDPSGRFVHWTARPPQHGPVFFFYWVYSWLLVALGTLHFLGSARRLGRASRVRTAAVVAAGLLPAVGNVPYVVSGASGSDPTPLLLGFAGVVIRLSLVDSGLAALLPLGQRRVLQQLRTGVLLADAEGVVVDANRAAHELLRGRLVGQTTAELLGAARLDPSRVVEVEQVPLRARFGTVGFAVLLTDRTESARLERELEERQKLESLGILAGGVAHDFDRLLRGMLGDAGVVSMTLPLDHPARPRIEGLIRAAKVATDLTAQLFAYSGKQPFALRPLDLSAEVRDLEPLLRSSVGDSLRLILDLDEELPRVSADPVGVQQILMNLTQNAAESMEGPGEVWIRTYLADLDESDLARLAPGSRAGVGRHLVLEVRDTGRGMEEEVRRRVFDPFFSTRPGGRGLGLAATLGIANAHGGGVALLSSPGKGSTFRVFLPLPSGAAAVSYPGEG